MPRDGVTRRFLDLRTEREGVCAKCVIPGCGRPTARVAGNGLSGFHCRYHVQFKSRHGSFWHPTYRAAELRPYERAASVWADGHRDLWAVQGALSDLGRALSSAPRVVVPANDLRGLSATVRARIAFARLREAGIDPNRLLSIYLGVAALVNDDWTADPTREFRIVQAAKAAHRLASGTHKSWEQQWRSTDRPVRLELHAYPRSAGLVLRRIGETLEKACVLVERDYLEEIIATKTELFGDHQSHHPERKQNADR